MNVPQIEFLRVVNTWLENHENHQYATVPSDTNPHMRNVYIIVLGGWAINRYDLLRDTDDIDILIKERQLTPLARYLLNTHGYKLISAPDSNKAYTRKMTFELKQGGSCFSLEARFLENEINFNGIMIDRDWFLLGSEPFHERTIGLLPFVKVPSQSKLIILKIISVTSRPESQIDKICKDFVDIIGVEKSLINISRHIDEVFLLIEQLKITSDLLSLFQERYHSNKVAIKRDLQGDIDDNSIIFKIFEKINRKSVTNLEGLAPQLIRVRGGSFSMGSNDIEEERPIHKVIVDDFYIGKHLVTFDDYDSYCEAMTISKPGDEGWGRGQKPVINITWVEVVKYCNWLSQKNNLEPAYVIDQNEVNLVPNANGYKLPTEAQWEYAARGGNQDKGFKYPGSNNINEVSWYEDNSQHQTHIVGEKKSNQLGIHDMSGNVWEWCLDNWNENYEHASIDGNLPYMEKNGIRMVRGGYWGSKPIDCRSTARCDWREDSSDLDLGFRLCRNF